MKSTAYTAFTRAIDDAIELLVRAHTKRTETKLEQRDFLSRRFWWINEKLGSVDDDVLAFELEEILIRNTNRTRSTRPVDPGRDGFAGRRR